MPATQGYRLDEWHEPPFLGHRRSLELTPDSRVFNPESIEDVATCLLETDPLIDAHRWTMSDGELSELALESAKKIIEDRHVRYDKNLENIARERFENARQERRLTKGAEKLAVVLSIAQNLETGESHIEEWLVPARRNFG